MAGFDGNVPQGFATSQGLAEALAPRIRRGEPRRGYREGDGSLKRREEGRHEHLPRDLVRWRWLRWEVLL